MVTFLITSLLVVAIIAIAVYFWQKPASKPETFELPPPRATALFADSEPSEVAETAEHELLTSGEAERETDQTLRAREELDAAIQSWRESPTKSSIATMLHLAATTDDAETYRATVELALDSWQGRSITDLSAGELLTLMNSEYWLLSSQTRSSGAGFVLKRTLSTAKRELENTNNRT